MNAVYEQRLKPQGGSWEPWSVERPAEWIKDALIVSDRKITIHFKGHKSQWRQVTK